MILCFRPSVGTLSTIGSRFPTSNRALEISPQIAGETLGAGNRSHHRIVGAQSDATTCSRPRNLSDRHQQSSGINARDSEGPYGSQPDGEVIIHHRPGCDCDRAEQVDDIDLTMIRKLHHTPESDGGARRQMRTPGCATALGSGEKPLS